MLTFEEATHTFRRDGVVVPSVTQCIDAGGHISRFATTHGWARERGVRVHQAVYALTQRDEDAALACLDPDDVPYFTAAQWWMRSMGVEVLAAEELVDGGDYAGWLDLRVTVRGRRHVPTVVDLKTGSLPLWVGYQLAAYAKPQAEHHDRMAVRLRLNGEPVVKVYDREKDWRQFRACVRAWEQKHGW